MISFIRKFQFSKICKTAKQAIEGMKDNSKVLVGGFGLCGIPMNLINAVRQSGAKDLTVVSNNAGVGADKPETDWGLGVLLRSHQIKRMVASYVGENKQFQRQYLSGELQVELVPQGTLAEKIRAGGAGIPAFYTPTGYKTWIQQGGFPIKYKQSAPQADKKQQRPVEVKSDPKEVRAFKGNNYVLQQSIVGDFALIKAQKADKYGNLVYNCTARNFNQDMATAGKIVVAEVEEIVDWIEPDQVHTPSVYVDRIFLSDPENPFSKKKIQKLVNKGDDKPIKGGDVRVKIIQRVAKQIKTGMVINLGIGIPTLLPGYLDKDIKIDIHSQNGVLGVGDYPEKGRQHADKINAGKETITLARGASLFSSSQSFAMVRGGHLDLTILGAMQVSKSGDIANWIIPGKMVKGMGGAMDLVACKSRVIVAMEHTAKGTAKLLEKCKLPLTAEGVVSMVVTEKAVFENIKGTLVLTEVAAESSLQEVQKLTAFKIEVSKQLKTF